MKKINFKINNLLRVSLLLILIYAAYYALTDIYADYIIPPARQSVIFLYDVLETRFEIGQPKTLILGDSTAAFGYSAAQVPETLSLAIFNGSFAEIYYAYKKYLDLFPAPRCIVLSASYNWAYHRDGRFWDTYALNGFYGWNDLNDIYETSKKVGDFPAIEHSKIGFFFKFLLYKMRLQGIHLSDIQDAIFKQSVYKGNKRFYKSMRDNAGSINKSNSIFPFIWEPHAHLSQPFKAAPLYDEYLKRLISMANSKGTQVHWLQLPISARVYNDMAKKHYIELDRHLRPIVMSSSLNTFDGEAKIYPDTQLFSATHLNISGARRFTNENRLIFENCK